MTYSSAELYFPWQSRSGRPLVKLLFKETAPQIKAKKKVKSYQSAVVSEHFVSVVGHFLILNYSDFSLFSVSVMKNIKIF